jgi:hypothetical protein
MNSWAWNIAFLLIKLNAWSAIANERFNFWWVSSAMVVPPIGSLWIQGTTNGCLNSNWMRILRSIDSRSWKFVKSTTGALGRHHQALGLNGCGCAQGQRWNWSKRQTKSFFVRLPRTGREMPHLVHPNSPEPQPQNLEGKFCLSQLLENCTKPWSVPGRRPGPQLFTHVDPNHVSRRVHYPLWQLLSNH